MVLVTIKGEQLESIPCICSTTHWEGVVPYKGCCTLKFDHIDGERHVVREMAERSKAPDKGPDSRNTVAWVRMPFSLFFLLVLRIPKSMN
jgi:hypothetical protein